MILPDGEEGVDEVVHHRPESAAGGLAAGEVALVERLEVIIAAHRVPAGKVDGTAQVAGATFGHPDLALEGAGLPELGVDAGEGDHLLGAGEEVRGPELRGEDGGEEKADPRERVQREVEPGVEVEDVLLEGVELFVEEADLSDEQGESDLRTGGRNTDRGGSGIEDPSRPGLPELPPAGAAEESGEGVGSEDEGLRGRRGIFEDCKGGRGGAFLGQERRELGEQGSQEAVDAQGGAGAVLDEVRVEAGELAELECAGVGLGTRGWVLPPQGLSDEHGVAAVGLSAPDAVAAQGRGLDGVVHGARPALEREPSGEGLPVGTGSFDAHAQLFPGG